MGGLGKTRLSLQIAADFMDGYTDGVWFVDLAPITDPSLIASEAAQVLGVREEPGRPLTQTLCAHVKPRKLLLILDNCEHLINESASLANALLKAAPDIRIIATSRQALHVPGEQTFPVLPLPIPERTAGVEELARSTAVQLFVVRSKLHQPGFEPVEKDASAIAEVVARLGGIPPARNDSRLRPREARGARRAPEDPGHSLRSLPGCGEGGKRRAAGPRTRPVDAAHRSGSRQYPRGYRARVAGRGGSNPRSQVRSRPARLLDAARIRNRRPQLRSRCA